MSDEKFLVELPGGGGSVPLQTQEEVDRWQTLEQAYTEQYDLRKINDKTNLATLLVQQINVYRGQLALSGRVPEIDDIDGLPTGRLQQKVLKSAEIKAYQEAVREASKEVREIEKTMGIDKRSRDLSGDDSAKAWLVNMKAKAHRYGLHVSKRVLFYEELAMELRWRVRLNEQGSAEDKGYEECTDEGIVKYVRERLAEAEQKDREFAQEEGALVLGRYAAP